MLQSDASITQAHTVATDQFRVNDDATTSLKISPFNEHGQFKNALAPRGGVAFDGTSAKRIDCVLTNQNLATDPFSLSWMQDFPTSNPAVVGGLATLSQAADGNITGGAAFDVLLLTNGKIQIEIFAADASNERYVTTAASVVAAYGGKRCHCAVVRNASGQPTLYINALAQTLSADSTAGGSPPANWQAAVTSTYLTFGDNYTGTQHNFIGCLYGLTLYNSALSQSDVQEIHELGGAVPERFKFGSQVNRALNGSFESDTSSPPSQWQHAGNHVVTALADGTAPSGANVAEVVASGAGSLAANYFRQQYGTQMVRGRTYRIRYFAKSISGSTSLQLYASQNVTDYLYAQTITTSWVEYIIAAHFVGSDTPFALVFLAAATATLRLDAIQIQQVGAVVHLPLDDGFTYLLKDQSTNKLHAVMTTTGVTHVLPQNRPHHVRGTTNTNGNQQAYGQVLIPANSKILSITMRAQSGTPTAKMGSSSGGAELVASGGLTTAWADKTIALSGGICTADTSIWINSNSTDVIEFDVLVIPLSA